jgi:histidyl-tRNA synthetase
MSGVFFGLDRIYLVVEELNLFRKRSPNQALFINYGDTEAFYALQAIQKLRSWYKSRIVSR